jgi:chromosome segregation ATPase
MNPAPLPIMKIRCHITFGLLLLPALFAPASAFGERLYKWIDANGQVHYSSQLPPEAAKQRREILDKQGRTLKVYRAPPTPEEKAEAKRLAELEAKKQQRAEKRAIRDRSLLATYSSKKDMYVARDSRIAAIESLIHLTTSRISAMRHRLEQLTEDAAGYERSGKKMPASLLSQISNLHNHIKRNREFVEDKKQEIEDIRVQFDSDIRRYGELTSGKPDAKSRKGSLSPLEAALRNKNIKLTRHDRTLLATYASEDDLNFARDQEIRSINAVISESSKRLDTMQTQLSELSENASEYQDRNDIPPAPLLRKMKQLIGDIESAQTRLEETRRKKHAIEARYTNDINRYHQLVSGKHP